MKQADVVGGDDGAPAIVPKATRSSRRDNNGILGAAASSSSFSSNPSSHSASPATPYSLVNPNLTGLWSCALLKGTGRLAFYRGAFSLLCLCGSWVLGSFIPFLAIHFLYRGGVVGDFSGRPLGDDQRRDLLVGTTLLLILSYPYVVPNIRPSAAVARFWLRAADYFEGGCSMSYEEREHDDVHTVPQMNCYHPHGIFTLGLILNSGIRSSAADHSGPGTNMWEKYVGTAGRIPCIGLAAPKLVQMPIFRHIMVKWTGNIESASKSHMVSKMRKGDCFGLMPGGFHEVSLFVKGRDRVYLKKTGFIYYALKYGYMVTPAYTFGECDTFYNVPGLNRLRGTLANWGVPLILITGPWLYLPILSLLPFRKGVGLHTVHGKGRKFPKIENPTKEQVKEYHAWYCKALNDLFERHKGRFGITHALEIIE